MTVIYIRHGDDNEYNSKYENDPRLREDCLKDVHARAKRLIRKYGRPDLICVSPMSRAIDTCDHLTDYLDDPRIRVYPELSRFFTRSERTDNKAIAPQTFHFGVPIGESHEDFKRRVQKHMQHFQKRKYYQRHEPVVWCITHALVMKRVAKTFMIPLPSRLDFLEYFVI